MEKYTFTIPAYGKQDVNATGNRIYCEAATGVFYLKSGTQTFELKSKRTYVLKQGVTKFLLENPSAAPITVEVHIGDDEIIDNEVLITGTISGDVKVVNSDTVGKTILKVDDDETQTRVAEVRDHANIIKDDIREMREAYKDVWGGKGRGRKGYTSLENASYATAAGANVTAVTAGANVNGILLKYARCHQYNTGTCGLKVDSNYLIRGFYASGGTGGSEHIEAIFIPAGKSLVLETNQSTNIVDAWYEVL